METRKKITKIKSNKRLSPFGGASLKIIGLVVILGLILIGVVLTRKWKGNRSAVKNAENSSGIQNQNTNQNVGQNKSTTEQPPATATLPSALQVELPQNKKTARVERNSLNQQEIIFYSSASADDIIAFYKKWAPAHNFVFLPEEQSLAQPERIAFSLIPGFGADGLYTHYFILEPKESEVRVILSYSDLPAQENKEGSGRQEVSVPKDFKIKL